jgi:hypothetical protein
MSISRGGGRLEGHGCDVGTFQTLVNSVVKIGKRKEAPFYIVDWLHFLGSPRIVSPFITPTLREEIYLRLTDLSALTPKLQRSQSNKNIKLPTQMMDLNG